MADRRMFAVGMAGLAIGIALAVRLLAPADWDPSVVAAFGDDATDITAYAEAQLGREVVVRDDLGHDGKFFFIQANDPWYIQPDEHAVWLDRPLYRAQRMLYPVLASAGGLIGPEAVLWGMLIVNVVAMGLGAAVTGSLAVAHGASAWWGLAFPLNLGMIDEFGIGGAGIVAFAAAMAAVWLFDRGRDRQWAAAGLLTMAVLAREAMLLFAAGLVVYALVVHRYVAWRLAALPAIGVALWAVYLRVQITGQRGTDEVQELGPPLVGLLRAVPAWRVIDWVVIGAWLILAALLILRSIRNPTALAWGSIGFVVLAMFFTQQVWTNFYDISRATAPVLTAWVFATFVDTRIRREGQPLA